MSKDHGSLVEFLSAVEFDASVHAGYMKHYVSIPDEIADTFTEADVTHVEGRLNGQPFRRILQVRSDGTHCLMFGMSWLKQAGLHVGEQVLVELEPDLNPDRVDVPAELMAELDKNSMLAEAWAALPPGRRKMLGYDIERAKRPETRRRRVKAIIDELRPPIDPESQRPLP